MTDKLEQLKSVFRNSGEKVHFGCDESSIPKQIENCRAINKSKQFCVISKWCIWHIQAPNAAAEENPILSVIKSDHVIEDEMGRFPIGGWVRSSPIQTIHENCIFETGNTFYIAVGNGTQKPVLANDAIAFV